MTDTKQPPERRVVLPVDPARRTEIDKQRVPMSARPYRLLALVKPETYMNESGRSIAAALPVTIDERRSDPCPDARSRTGLRPA